MDKAAIKRKLLLIGIGAAALGSLTVYLIFYHPLQVKLGPLGSECRAIEEEARQARNTISKFKQAGAVKRVVSEGEVSQVIDELTKLGKWRGINFVSLTPGFAEKFEDSPYRVLPIEMETGSSYQALGEFLGSLDGMEKGLATVEGFEIAQNEKNPAKLRTKLRIMLYLAD